MDIIYVVRRASSISEKTPETPLADRVVEIQIPVNCEPDHDKELTNQKEHKMEPVKYETLPAFNSNGYEIIVERTVLGEIGEVWDKLNPRCAEIPMISKDAFGVCLMINDAAEGEFEYIAGFKVSADAIPPTDMVVVDVPENKYAVFEHRGAKETLMNTYHLIANEWFPRSGFKPTGGYDMELYDEKFKNFEIDSIMYIYEPIK